MTDAMRSPRTGYQCSACGSRQHAEDMYGRRSCLRCGRGMSREPIDVCAGCGQTLLTTPDDPMRSLWCDTCEGGAK